MHDLENGGADQIAGLEKKQQSHTKRCVVMPKLDSLRKKLIIKYHPNATINACKSHEPRQIN